ncbi:hypothetical protein [Curtobacterium aurantiacum]|uniref:hypothetical protein n=1 Tax=Curtobacterium aurantiacum TaxID=3236919 RepID=UPI001BDE23DB|nr:hypothetical protein [Curtobacterium flaccumfaciens]MBT1679861.1 hypothetical protein [Curtobacterium flaccumfaciens pv. flaccumfaciens]
MAAHRMPESDRPRRPVPAWVTAPPVDEVAPERVAAAGHVNAAGREARPTPASSRAAHAAPVPPTTVAPAAHVPAVHAPAAEPTSIAALVESDAPVPDFPPQQDQLPPAPMSPSVHTVPFENPAVPAATIAPSGALAMPVSPAVAVPAPAPTVPPTVAPTAGALSVAPAVAEPAPMPTPAATTPAAPAPAAPAVPTVPVAGQPRFSVPGLEHVVVEGTEPEPVGPIGYRTPRRFAHQQAAAAAAKSAALPTPGRSFDAVLHATPSAAAAPVVPVVTPTADAAATAALVAPVSGPERPGGGDAGLPTELLDQPVAAAATPEPRRALGATAGAVLGAVAGIATIGLAAWWFSAPATVHGVGVVLGLLALVLSIVTLRDRTATWQRPVTLVGAVLGGLGTIVLLWAVAAALLPLVGVTLPDVTGTGTTPTLAP